MGKNQIEMHDVVFVVAKTDEEASVKIQKKWIGTSRSLHVDSWFIIEEVDGFNIKLSEKNPVNNCTSHLYFVNLGYYKKDVFGELHFMTLVVAESKTKAVQLAKSQRPQDCEMLHSDNIHDLNDCIQIEEVDQYFIELEYTGANKHVIFPTNGYQKLRTPSSDHKNSNISDREISIMQ